MGKVGFFSIEEIRMTRRGWRGGPVLPIHQTFIKSEQWVYSILKISIERHTGENPRHDGGNSTCFHPHWNNKKKRVKPEENHAAWFPLKSVTYGEDKSYQLCSWLQAVSC